MATRNEDLKYRLLGEDVSAGRTFRKVSDEARGAHSAISSLGQTLGSVGAFTPFTQGLDAISMGFQHIRENGHSARVVMQGAGIGIAAAGAALLGLGASAQQASAGLKQAIQDAGGTFSDYSKAIDETVRKTSTFGRTAADTKDALARLTTATQDPSKALSLMGLTANIAASRNMNLTDSAQLLTTALAGNTRVFRQFGINVGTGKLSADQLNKALDELNQRLSGRAQAQADTFSGRIKGIAVGFENAFESLTKFSPLLLTVGATMTIASAGWDLLAKAKERNAVADIANIASSRRVAASEIEAGTAAAAAGGGFGAIGAAGASGIIGPAFTRGNFMRAGGFAVGGLLAGDLAGAALGNGAGGSAVSDAIKFGGSGAALGTFFGPEGTLIGGGIGAAGGALYGLLNHGSGAKGKLAALQKNLVTAQTSADTSAQDAFMWSEFDPLGNPKAKALASATETLAKAKERLTRAQADLNKTQAKGQDPLKLEAATAHLTAAEANLRKAEYVGGDARIASAQAAVASAQARLQSLHAGTSSTAAARRVADARQAVADASRARAAARLAAQGPSASGFLTALQGQATDKQQGATDVATLVDRFHIGGPILKQIEAQGDAAVHHIATTMTQGLARRFNQAGASMEDAAKAWKASNDRAFKTAAAALGKQMADSQMAAYRKRLALVGIPNGGGPLNLGAPMSGPTDLAGLLTGRPGSVGEAGVDPSLSRILIGTLNVQANDPQKLTRELSDQVRHRALSGTPTNARLG